LQSHEVRCVNDIHCEVFSYRNCTLLQRDLRPGLRGLCWSEVLDLLRCRLLLYRLGVRHRHGFVEFTRAEQWNNSGCVRSFLVEIRKLPDDFIVTALRLLENVLGLLWKLYGFFGFRCNVSIVLPGNKLLS